MHPNVYSCPLSPPISWALLSLCLGPGLAGTWHLAPMASSCSEPQSGPCTQGRELWTRTLLPTEVLTTLSSATVGVPGTGWAVDMALPTSLVLCATHPAPCPFQGWVLTWPTWVLGPRLGNLLMMAESETQVSDSGFWDPQGTHPVSPHPGTALPPSSETEETLRLSTPAQHPHHQGSLPAWPARATWPPWPPGATRSPHPARGTAEGVPAAAQR